MQFRMKDGGVSVELPGYAEKAPKLGGYVCYFVARYGHDRTVFHYKREVKQADPKLTTVYRPGLMGGAA